MKIVASCDYFLRHDELINADQLFFVLIYKVACAKLSSQVY